MLQSAVNKFGSSLVNAICHKTNNYCCVAILSNVFIYCVNFNCSSSNAYITRKCTRKDPDIGTGYGPDTQSRRLFLFENEATNA